MIEYTYQCNYCGRTYKGMHDCATELGFDNKIAERLEKLKKKGEKR